LLPSIVINSGEFALFNIGMYMLEKLFKITLFLIVSYFATAQGVGGIDKAIQEIDSLLKYNKPNIAEQKADSLYEFLEKYTVNKKQLLKIRLLKGMAIDQRGEYVKALPIYLEALSEANKYGFNDIACEASIYISLIHEKNQDFVNAYTYINTALVQCRKYKIDQLYSRILIRLSSVHRMMVNNIDAIDPDQIQRLAKLGFTASFDSAMLHTKQAVLFAEKYKNEKDLIDCYFLMAIYYNYQNRDNLAIEYFLKTIPVYKKLYDYQAVFMQFHNVSRNYLQINETHKAMVYIDSAYKYYDRVTLSTKYIAPLQKSRIYKALNQTDSAYIYLQQAFSVMLTNNNDQSNLEIKKLEEQFQNDKKEETIKNKNRLLALFVGLLVLIAIAGATFINKNRQINAQNQVINDQLIHLKKVLEQKQILLSELQHRVKNNLQYVISILEIQKESVTYSNIEDLIRSNQNRIHSIALMHKKLNVSDSVNDVDLNRYIKELSKLVKGSYDNTSNNVQLITKCDIETLPITKALPIGLIIVELISNSMKHAFKSQENGVIDIEITKDEECNKLHYKDNGKGFDFENIATKGLGVEIMKGLIDQLNASIETHQNNGFELIIYFK
jgi:two-component sensor histidine kinase